MHCGHGSSQQPADPEDNMTPSRSSTAMSVAWICVLSVTLLSGFGHRTVAADWRCSSKWKCALIACKDIKGDPNSNPFTCYDQYSNVIPACTCNLTDTTQYTVCSYTSNANDNCVADYSHTNTCDGTYTPTGGQPINCYNYMYVCDPNPPKGPNGVPLACAQQ